MGEDNPTPPKARTVSGIRVLVVGALLVVGVAATAWLLRPEAPPNREAIPRSPTLTVGTSGEAARPESPVAGTRVRDAQTPSR